MNNHLLKKRFISKPLYFNLNLNYSEGAITPLTSEVTKDSAILKMNAHQKPSTLIPLTNFSASKITNALITKEKRPKVRMVSGKPKIFKIGVTIRFKIPKIKAKITADPNPSKCTPLRIFVRINATIAVTSNRIIKFIIYFFIKLKN